MAVRRPWRVLSSLTCRHAFLHSVFVVAALIATLASGCTAATERVVPWYITRKLDSYLDLTSQQEVVARATVDEILLLARTGELPHWISLLREVRQGIHQGLTDEAVARLQRRYDARLDIAVVLLVPRLASLLAQLDKTQIDHFAARMHDDLKEQYKELDKPPAERAAAIEKRGLKAIEDLVGDLSDEQKRSVRGLIRAIPNERTSQNRSAAQHIERFRAFMSERPSAARIEAELREMWEHRYDALGPGHDKTARRAQQRKWLLSVYQLLTAEQRAHAEEVITDRIVMLKRFVING